MIKKDYQKRGNDKRTIKKGLSKTILRECLLKSFIYRHFKKTLIISNKKNRHQKRVKIKGVRIKKGTR